MVPIPTGDPSSFGELRCKVTNSFGKLLRCIGVTQVDTRQLKAAGHEMHMRVVEPWKNELPASIDYPNIRAGELLYLLVCADGDDAIAEDGDGLCRRLILNHRVDVGVDDN